MTSVLREKHGASVKLSKRLNKDLHHYRPISALTKTLITSHSVTRIKNINIYLKLKSKKEAEYSAFEI